MLYSQISSQFHKYKFVLSLQETKSKKYSDILKLIHKHYNELIQIDSKKFHIIGFENSVNDFIALGKILKLTHGLRNISLFIDKELSEVANQIPLVSECTAKHKNNSLSCQEQMSVSTEIKDRNLLNKMSFGILGKKTYLETIINFPCKNIKQFDYSNPKDFDYIQYARKHHEADLLCPLCDLNNYYVKNVELQK